MSGIAKGISAIVIGIGVTWVLASMKFTVVQPSEAAAPEAQVVVPAEGKSGEPVSNEIGDLPQLD